MTYASLATFRIDLTHEEAQTQALRRMIVPSVRSTPGVICGHWTLDRAAGETLVLLHYESEEAATAMIASIRGNATAQRESGLELVDVRLLEMVASTDGSDEP